MSRYRKVEVQTWADGKFRSLSPIPPCGQGLWLFLMTGPHTSPIPGLFSAGRAGMAEALGWSVEAFDKAFQEAFAKGMAKADFEARLVWLPNAIRYNKPENPNVVKSWRSEIALLPECDLKNEALSAIKSFLSTMGDKFAQALEPSEKPSRKAFAKPLAKPLAKGMAKGMANQEQEQEQEQEKKNPAPLLNPDPGMTDVWPIARGVCDQCGLVGQEVRNMVCEAMKLVAEKSPDLTLEGIGDRMVADFQKFQKSEAGKFGPKHFLRDYASKFKGVAAKLAQWDPLEETARHCGFASYAEMKAFEQKRRAQA